MIGYRFHRGDFQERVTRSDWRSISLRDAFNLRAHHLDRADWLKSRGFDDAQERAWVVELTQAVADYVTFANRLAAEINAKRRVA